jgi:lysozyme
MKRVLIPTAVLALAAGIITKYEGLRFPPYRDAVGVLTVCYGHTGADIDPAKRYTKDECDALLGQDMADADAAVVRCLPMPMLNQIHAALLSATFNVGPRVVCGSRLQELALANDWPGACRALLQWRLAGGRVMRGLTLRRADEAALCLGEKP